MYQLEVKAALVASQFPKQSGWTVTVDVDAMERCQGGSHPADKRARAEAAFEQLEALGVKLGKKHPVFGRADIVAEHSGGEIVVLEVEGDSARQREQAMYGAIGQLLVSMRHDGPKVSYALAVPDTLSWRKQVEKIPLVVLSKLKLSVFLVGREGITAYPDETDITERILLEDETLDALPEDAVESITEHLNQYLAPPSKRR